MKKLFSFLTFILFFTSLIGQVSVGPKAGIVFSRNKNFHSAGNSTDNKMVIGYNLGIVIHYWFAKEFIFQPELSFVQKGNQYTSKVRYDSSFNVTEKIYTEKYNFIEIPLLFKFTTGDKIKLNVLVGPSISFNLGGHYKSEIPFIDESKDGKIIFDKQPENYMGDDLYLDPEYVKRLEFGIYIGIGISKQLGKGKLIADARFGLSTYTSLKSGGQSQGYFDYSNRSIQVILAYVFDLNK